MGEGSSRVGGEEERGAHRRARSPRPRGDGQLQRHPISPPCSPSSWVARHAGVVARLREVHPGLRKSARDGGRHRRRTRGRGGAPRRRTPTPRRRRTICRRPGRSRRTSICVAERRRRAASPLRRASAHEYARGGRAILRAGDGHVEADGLLVDARRHLARHERPRDRRRRDEHLPHRRHLARAVVPTPTTENFVRGRGRGARRRRRRRGRAARAPPPARARAARRRRALALAAAASEAAATTIGGNRTSLISTPAALVGASTRALDARRRLYAAHSVSRSRP